MSDTEVVPTAPPKRSLFRKKIYHQPVEEVKDGVEFFSRAKELFPIRLAEEEERRQKKAAKLERKRSSMDADRKSSSTPEPKKRRVSSQAPEEVEAVSSGEDDYKWVRNLYYEDELISILGRSLDRIKLLILILR